MESEQIVYVSFFHLHRYYFTKGALMSKETTEKQTPRYKGIPKQVSRSGLEKISIKTNIKSSELSVGRTLIGNSH